MRPPARHLPLALALGVVLLSLGALAIFAPDRSRAADSAAISLTARDDGGAFSPASQTTTGTAGASFTTAAVPCLFAKQVIWRVSSTTAKRCSLAVVETSDDSSTWFGASYSVPLANVAATNNELTVFENNAFGTGKSLIDVSVPYLSDASTFGMPILIPHRYVHAKFTFGYSGNYATLAAFTVTPIVVRDADHTAVWRSFY